MEVNWITIGVVCFFAIGLVVYLILQNMKEKKKLERKLNNDYKSTIKKDTEINDEVR